MRKTIVACQVREAMDTATSTNRVPSESFVERGLLNRRYARMNPSVASLPHAPCRKIVRYLKDTFCN